MSRFKKPLVASLLWEPDSQLHQVQGEVVQQLGYPHKFFYFDQPIPPEAKIILVQGPYGSLLPLTQQLIKFSADCRPVLAYWFQQSLNLLPPPPVRKLFESVFSELYRSFAKDKPFYKVFDFLSPAYLKERGARFRYAGDVLWLHRHQMLDILALSSSVYAEIFARYGINSVVVPRGYHPNYGELLGSERDIAAIWMGKMRTRRRRRAVYWLQEELKQRGLDMHIYDGQENDFVFDQERTQLLNRAWFVLNIFFSGPTDELSLRYYLAAANGAVVLTEPGQNKYPFIPRKHLIECPLEKMPDTISYYLSHRDEWSILSTAMLKHMKSEVTLATSIARILNRAEHILHSRNRTYIPV